MNYLVHFSMDDKKVFDWAWYDSKESLLVGIKEIKECFSDRKVCFHDIYRIPVLVNVLYSNDGRVVEQDL